MKRFKHYETPEIDVVRLTDEDILTISAGFDGEEHEFLLP